MPELTARLGLPDLTGDTELYPDDIADGFWRLDAVTDLYLKGRFVNDPPGSASDGDVWLVGGTPGAWRDDDTDFTYKLACRRDGAWWPVPPFNGLRAFVEGENRFIVYQDGSWTDWASLIGAGEDSIASAATCDIGAAGSLFLQITGTSTITAFGTGANRLRFVRFAGALTLTHNAASLILPGAADLTTAAGDTAIFTSDGSGNWRCRHYSRASGQPVAAALSAASLALGGDTSGALLGMCANHDGGTVARIANSDGGAGAFAGFQVSDGSARGGVFLNGAGASGIHRARSVELQSFGGSGISVITDDSQPITFIVNDSEAGRFGTDGSLLVGTTANAGAGAIAADYLVPKVCAFAALPAAPPNGSRAMISDGSVTAFNAVAAGGGSATVPVYYVAATGLWYVG